MASGFSRNKFLNFSTWDLSNIVSEFLFSDSVFMVLQFELLYTIIFFCNSQLCLCISFGLFPSLSHASPHCCFPHTLQCFLTLSDVSSTYFEVLITRYVCKDYQWVQLHFFLKCEILVLIFSIFLNLFRFSWVWKLLMHYLTCVGRRFGFCDTERMYLKSGINLSHSRLRHRRPRVVMWRFILSLESRVSILSRIFLTLHLLIGYALVIEGDTPLCRNRIVYI